MLFISKKESSKLQVHLINTIFHNHHALDHKIMRRELKNRKKQNFIFCLFLCSSVESVESFRIRTTITQVKRRYCDLVKKKTNPLSIKYIQREEFLIINHHFEGNISL
jgi:hypothetical protein